MQVMWTEFCSFATPGLSGYWPLQWHLSAHCFILSPPYYDTKACRTQSFLLILNHWTLSGPPLSHQSLMHTCIKSICLVYCGINGASLFVYSCKKKGLKKTFLSQSWKRDTVRVHNWSNMTEVFAEEQEQRREIPPVRAALHHSYLGVHTAACKLE